MIDHLKFVKIYQKFDSKKLNNIPEVISQEFSRIQLDQKIKPGMKIAILPAAGESIISRQY